LSVGASAPLRPETKGQAVACPDRTRAIPCKVQQSSKWGAMSCPLRARSDSNSGYLTVTRGQPPCELTCGYEAYESGAYVLLSNESSSLPHLVPSYS
jgi:hypothetical protein